MKTITLHISEQDLKRLSLSTENLTFNELVRKITAELAREALKVCHSISSKEGLKQLSIEGINAEIKAVRDAKNHS